MGDELFEDYEFLMQLHDDTGRLGCILQVCPKIKVSEMEPNRGVFPNSPRVFDARETLFVLNKINESNCQTTESVNRDLSNYLCIAVKEIPCWKMQARSNLLKCEPWFNPQSWRPKSHDKLHLLLAENRHLQKISKEVANRYWPTAKKIFGGDYIEFWESIHGWASTSTHVLVLNSALRWYIERDLTRNCWFGRVLTTFGRNGQGEVNRAALWTVQNMRDKRSRGLDGIDVAGPPGSKPEDDLMKQESDQIVEAKFKNLDSREQQVLRMKYGFGDGTVYTFGEIAATLGVTKQRANQIHNMAIQKLKNDLEGGLE